MLGQRNCKVELSSDTGDEGGSLTKRYRRNRQSAYISLDPRGHQKNRGKSFNIG